MTLIYPPQRPTAAAPSGADILRRRPQRITATISWALYQRLQSEADLQGRSLSGLVSFLLEHATTPG